MKIYVVSADPNHKLPYVENGKIYPGRYVGLRDGKPHVEQVVESGIIRKWVQRGYLNVIDEKEGAAIVEARSKAAIEAKLNAIAARDAKAAMEAETAREVEASREVEEGA